MSESSLRWRVRLGRLKALAVVVGLAGVVLLVVGLTSLSAALTNPAGPQEVEVAQLASGDIPANRHVAVAGLTNYGIFYQRTQDDKVVEEYYFVMDTGMQALILVEAGARYSETTDLQLVEVTGMTRRTPSKLQEMIVSDLGEIRSVGLTTTAGLYIDQGASPPTMATVIVLLALAGLCALLVTPVFLAPSIVFAPGPVEPVAGPVAGEPGVRASGLFLGLKSVQPPEVGRGTRKFEEAVANPIPQGDRRLLVYIHHVVTIRTYGIKVSQRESDWGILLGSDNIVAIETGKVLGWRDRPGVRLRYRDANGREQVLVISFDHAAAQAGFVGTLQQLGFSVSTMPPV